MSTLTHRPLPTRPTIGVDVGGTKIAAGLVDGEGTILATVRRPTPARDTAEVVDTIAELVAELSEGQDVEAVGIGAAGFIDSARSTVLFAPNLAWRDEPLKLKVEQRCGLPVVVENDANAAAWGEFRFGAAQEASSAVVITVGTGIGGGVILDNQLVRGDHGIAAEIGHIKVDRGGRRCGCGQRGCLESYCSGRALLREAREIARTSPHDAARLLELAGGSAEKITGLHVTRAAEEGDPAALECFGQVGWWLGNGMADLAAVLDPAMFVLAGGVSEAGDLLLAPAQAAFKATLSAADFRPVADVRLATLGNDAGIIGAADLARTR
ncbi:ROK family glucokinase [Raineyella fluvialis]|uniref:Glucokinase n=1 Tax=Raineyella fluvialis TaxID=2662261 RepID=A0A5Q2FAI1_9ACTN|nr:ROK family glucokinase [Raineyella fluvialis]QGF23698.1 ROK family glucokinase [Raineyella fluvialis]